MSPTEPRELRSLGTVSSVPELYGSDFLLFGPTVGKVGVQRKEIADFAASLDDDRLAVQAAKSRPLNIRMLLLEGRVDWTNDGLLYGTRSRLTRARFLGALWSLSSEGYWINYTNSLTETIECLLLFSRWITKQKHTTLRTTRSSPKNLYGTRGSEDWQIHVLQSFPGVGYERARSVVEYFGGLPLTWTGTLSDVPGIGTKTATRLSELLK